MGQPLQTRLKLLFSKVGVDVTESLLPDILSFAYDDKESGEADEISLTLKDETGKWAGTWKPDGGEFIRAYIKPGNVKEATQSLYCGKFFVDELSTSGSPRTFQLKAISVPFDKPMRRKLKSRSWEKKKLKDIAQDIAEESEMDFMWDSEENPEYDRIDQKRESDLKFLSRICGEAGLSIKVTDAKIVIFDQELYESKSPVQTFTLGKSDILSWSFSATQSDTYKSCTIKYFDVKTDKEISYTYEDPNADDNGNEYAMKERANSSEEAKRMAKKRLRKLNARKLTGNMTVIGNVSLVAGTVIACKGFGSFDGNFIVEKATHSIASGYTTAVDLRRVNSDY